jgi:hypothetical protein
MAGLPGISVPAGLSQQGTPLGLQLIGKPFDEATLFRAAQAIEDAAGRFTVTERWWEGETGKGTATKSEGKKSEAAAPKKAPSAKTDAAPAKAAGKTQDSKTKGSKAGSKKK